MSKNSGRGFSKRKKKLDPKSGLEQLEVKLNSEVVLPTSLQEVKEILINQGKKWSAGEIKVQGITYPVIFMPFTKYYQGRLKLYSQVAFANESHPKISQKLIDRISRKVCRQIKDKYEDDRG